MAERRRPKVGADDRTTEGRSEVVAIDPQERLAAKQVLRDTEALARELDIPAKDALVIRQLVHLQWIENQLQDWRNQLAGETDE